MGTVYGYNKKTKRFTMEWEGKEYYFMYDFEQLSVTRVWDSQNKLIAKSYKGFRTKLNILGGTAKANEFISLFKICKQFANI